MASGNPEPVVEFYLPDLNVTINETDGRFNFYTNTDGHTTTGMIKLREKGERVDNGPAVNVHCSIYNMYGRESAQLELQQESKLGEQQQQPHCMCEIVKGSFSKTPAAKV